MKSKLRKNEHSFLGIPTREPAKMQKKEMLNKKVENRRTFYIYCVLAVLRVVLTCLPQRGYIHPDEYFQSIEVIAGETFDVEFHQPWEFNKTHPIRSIVIPYITAGLPYRLLRLVDLNLKTYVNTSIQITPYFLLMLPRLFVCLSSFLVDFSLYKICKINNEIVTKKLLFLSSSYVMFIYGTRTFSNSVEMVLMSLLLYLVAESQAYSRNVITRYEYINDRYRNARAAVERARFYKLKLLLPSHSLRHCIAISVITVTGVFNRPTFIMFSSAPVFFWFHRGLGCKSVNFSTFHLRMLVFLLYGFATFVLFILVDSVYFGHLSMAEVMQWDVSIDNFVVTPLNFIRYNMDARNLAEHGIHMRSLHILVNVPLLYNVLGVVTICGMIVMLYRLIMGQYTTLPHIYSIEGLMTTSVIAPVVALSYFPHQEPRFLIPVTLPIVLLYSDYIIRKRYLCRLWITLNLVCLIFYGFVHQAGLYPATIRLSRDVHLSKSSQHPIHLVTSHVYSLPVSLLQHPNPERVYEDGVTKYRKPSSFHLQEMGSTSLGSVAKRLSVLLHIVDNVERERRSKLYLLLPTSRIHEIRKMAGESNMSLTEIDVFYPHVSTEAMPDLWLGLVHLYENFSLGGFVREFVGGFGLGLYQVHRI